MKKNHLIMCMTMILLLVACNEDTDKNNSISKPVATESESINNDSKENNENAEVENEVEVDSETASPSPTDLESVFEQMAIASKTIESVTIKGHNFTTTTMMGNVFDEENEINAKILLKPYTQYIENIAIAGDTIDSEMYLDSESIYISSDDGGWSKMMNILDDIGIANSIQEKQINHFIANIDVFKLTDVDDHYVITFIGPDELFKDVIHSDNMTPDALAGLMENIEQEIELTGELEMKLSKDTFLLTEYRYIMNSIITGMINMEITDDVTSTFTYNNVDNFTIPQEVVDQAKVIEIPEFN